MTIAFPAASFLSKTRFPAGAVGRALRPQIALVVHGLKTKNGGGDLDCQAVRRRCNELVAAAINPSLHPDDMTAVLGERYVAYLSIPCNHDAGDSAINRTRIEIMGARAVEGL